LSLLRRLVGLIALVWIGWTAWHPNFATYLTFPSEQLRGIHPDPDSGAPNFRTFLDEVRRTTPKSVSIGLMAPHHGLKEPWPSNYTRRAKYLLAGRSVLQVEDAEQPSADYVMVWSASVSPSGYQLLWSKSGGSLYRRSP
jgi:hypothetical protein